MYVRVLSLPEKMFLRKLPKWCRKHVSTDSVKTTANMGLSVMSQICTDAQHSTAHEARQIRSVVMLQQHPAMANGAATTAVTHGEHD